MAPQAIFLISVLCLYFSFEKSQYFPLKLYLSQVHFFSTLIFSCKIFSKSLYFFKCPDFAFSDPRFFSKLFYRFFLNFFFLKKLMYRGTLRGTLFFPKILSCTFRDKMASFGTMSPAVRLDVDDGPLHCAHG